MEPRFNILTFPQRVENGELHVRFLILPRLSAAWNGDPLQPVIADFPNPGDQTPAYADADWQLEARIHASLDDFPTHDPVDLTVPLPAASGAPADARQLFEELVAPVAGRFQLANNPPALAEPVQPQIFIKKYLPQSYRGSFLFTGPRTGDAVTDDSYHCAIKAAKEPNPNFQVTPDEVSWGQIYAYCLRHPLLARRLGFIREAEIPLTGGLFSDGGFLFAGLAADSDFRPQVDADFDFLKRYAARIPRLDGQNRPVFAAVQFPVLFDDPLVPGLPPVPGNYDAVLIEAAEYDDGFAKIVHAGQPVSQNLLAEDADGFAPLTDLGVRLGWDDEQILIWQNRQLKEDSTVGAGQRLDAPMGVFGYRVDAREQGAAAWHSLVRVRSKAPLQLGAVDLDVFEGELGVEVHPMQLDGDQANGQYWLPAFLASWNGRSLVLPDEDAARIYQVEQEAGQAASLGRMYDAVGLGDVPLRYGRVYDFRVRLMDTTGGGPRVGAEPVYESPAPDATLPFRRHVVPEPVRIDGLPRLPDVPLDTFFAGDTLTVDRPLLGYPSVVFTGKYAEPIPLLEAASQAAAGQDSFGIPDPDVQRVRVDVEVRTLKLDNRLSLSGREAFIHLYTTHRDFPAELDQARQIPLDFRDAPVLKFGDPADLGDDFPSQAEIDALDQLVLPTAREIRLTVRAVADADSAYFADGAHVGKPLQVKLRRESSSETDLFVDTGAAERIRGIYLQPDPEPPFDGRVRSLLFQRTTGGSPALIQRLAQQLEVDHKGLTLVAERGERVVFGCSRRIRHTLAPDGSSLTFAAKEDLLNHWLVAISLQVDRDWTWDALEPVSFELFRTRVFPKENEVDDNQGQPIGDWEVLPMAPIQALQDPERGHTALIFLDAVEPKSETHLPDVVELTYQVETRLGHGAPTDEPEMLELTLPVTTPPAQVPRIVSAGIALSKYQRDETYSATEPRQRFLWLELEEPPVDPNDTYFIRLLANAPDPLLSDNRLETFVPPEEPALGVDPELIRVITPVHSDDRAGLGAMTPLEPATGSDRHFLVPLPPGLHPESPELFGFFTYELRVGHLDIWSTAQGRFGRPLRSTGVQHPAPTLFCTNHRDHQKLTVEAPYAQAVLNGKNITADPPRTEIWALLYAQVRQADGKDYRNILLDDRVLRLLPPAREPITDVAGNVLFPIQNRDAAARGVTHWSQDEIRNLLRGLCLPTDSPLSVLCVEMLPTLAALQRRARSRDQGVPAIHDLAAGVAGERSGSTSAFDPTGAGPQSTAPRPRPLSDALGHFRILRTSQLTPVPEVCA